MSSAHTFQYISGPDGGVNSRGHVPPTQLSGRRKTSKKKIRVKDGDKCVAPAKSKIRMRTNLGSTDLGFDMSMDNINWTSDSFTVKSLVENYGYEFPVIVKIIHGYRSNEADAQFNMGQILQVHAFAQQGRIRVTDDSGNSLSIPLDYDVTVEVKQDNNHTETMQLDKAVHQCHLPTTVFIRSGGAGMRVGDVNITGSYVTMQQVHEDIYLRANIIREGWIDQSCVAMVPSFLGMKFIVGLNMSGATITEWDDFQNMYSRSVRIMHIEEIPGYQGVVSLDNNAVATSGFTPVAVASLTRPDDSLYQNVDGMKKQPEEKLEANRVAEDRLYQNLDQFNQPKVKNPITERIRQEPLVISWPRNRPTTIDYTANDDVILEEKPKAPPPIQRDNKPKTQKHSYENVKVKQGMRVNPGAGDVSVHRTMDGVVNPAYTPDGRIMLASSNPARVSRASSMSSALQSGRPPSGRLHSSTTTDSGDDLDALFEGVIREGEAAEKRSSEQQLNEVGRLNPVRNNFSYSSAREPREMGKLRETSFIAQHDNESNDWLSKHQRAAANRPAKTGPLPPAKPTDHNRKFTKNQPKAVVAPTRQTPNYAVSINVTSPSKSHVHVPNTHNLPPIHDNPTTGQPSVTAHYNSVEEIPEDIDSLTVEELCECLVLLNMHSHVEQFRRKQIDGVLISSIKENVLIAEFGFTDFNASKLMRFVRGWRPKLV